MSNKRSQKKSYLQPPLEEKTAIQKLVNTSTLIARHGTVKPHESKRIMHAFHLLNNSYSSNVEVTARKQQQYRQFLMLAKETGGLELVMLCAVCFGQRAVTNTKERDRLLLPGKLGKCEYKQDGLSDIVKAHSPIESQTNLHLDQVGRNEVYGLTIEDARATIMSNDFQGITMLIPYNTQLQAFLSIPLSQSCTWQLAQRSTGVQRF